MSPAPTSGDHHVDVDGFRVTYRIAGTGRAIVLVKNNRRPRDLGTATLLSDCFRTVQIQPVGFGASDRPDQYDFGSIDRQVLAVLDEEGIDDFVVWGFSQTAHMAALVARATTRAVALVLGGAEPLGHPSDAEMHRLEREPRLPIASLEFWRAFRSHDWHHELRRMRQPKLVYIGTQDPRIRRLRRLAPTLHAYGCDYLEFEGLDHTTAGLAEAGADGRTTSTAVVRWLHGKLGS